MIEQSKAEELQEVQEQIKRRKALELRASIAKRPDRYSDEELQEAVESILVEATTHGLNNKRRHHYECIYAELRRRAVRAAQQGEIEQPERLYESIRKVVRDRTS